MATFPSKFIQAKNCTITSETETELTSYGMVTQVGKRGNPHKWAIEFTTRLHNEEDIRELGAFLDSLDGRFTEFNLPCPLRFMTNSNDFSIVNTIPAGFNVITIQNGIIAKAGDFIKFTNHDKVYKIVSFNASNGTIEIYPRLFTQVPSTARIQEAIFTCRMTKDKTSLRLDGGKMKYPLLVTAIEK